MTTVTLPDEQLRQALDACIPTLRQMSAYQLDPWLMHRMETMGERKEFLSADEQAELLALVRFAQQRNNEKLQAELALKRLRAAFPNHVGAA